MSGSQFIREQQGLYPTLGQEYEGLDNLYTQRLWHQLSIDLEKFVTNKSNMHGDNFHDLYHGFIAPIGGRLSQLRLVQIVSIISFSFENSLRSIDFLTQVLENRTRLGEEASLYLDSDIIVMKLRLGNDYLEESRLLLDSAKEKLQSSNTTEAIVFSKYYKAVTEYRKVAGPPEEYYKASLIYLAYTPIDTLSEMERYQLATDIALSALTGEGVYNFGEVIATPLLSILQHTSNQFLYEMILCMNHGDIDTYNTLVHTHHDQYFQHEVLKIYHEKIQQKVILLALMDMIFKRSSHDRILSFSDIAQKARIPVEQVDWVLMKALSLGLIKGVIDEVNQTVNVSWVQPRVLGTEQISLVVSQLTEWSDRVKRTLVTVEEQTLEFYV